MIWWALGWYLLGLLSTTTITIHDSILNKSLTIENIMWTFFLAMLGPIIFISVIVFLIQSFYESNKKFFTKNLLEKKK